MGAEAWVLKGEVVSHQEDQNKVRGTAARNCWNGSPHRRPQAGRPRDAGSRREKVGPPAREAATAGRSERLPGWREVLVLLVLLVPGREHRNVAATIEGIAAVRRLFCMRLSLCCAIQLQSIL